MSEPRGSGAQIFDDADSERVTSGATVNSAGLGPISTLDSMEAEAEAARRELVSAADKEREQAQASGLLETDEKFDVDEVEVFEEQGDASLPDSEVDEAVLDTERAADVDVGLVASSPLEEEDDDDNLDDLGQGFTQVNSEEVIPQMADRAPEPEEDQAPLSQAEQISFRSRMAAFKGRDEAVDTTPSLSMIKAKSPQTNPIDEVQPAISEVATVASESTLPEPPALRMESDEATPVESPAAPLVVMPEGEPDVPKAAQEPNEDLVTVEQTTDATAAAPASASAPLGEIPSVMGADKASASREKSVSTPLDPKQAWAKKQFEMDPRPRVAPRKVKEITNWVEPDLYGRGYMGIFGTGAEAKNAQEARRIMDRIKNSRFPVAKEDHVDYDNYGRADPRIFGVGSNIASKKQAAAKSAELQARALKERRKNAITFQAADKRLQDKPVTLVHDYMPPKPATMETAEPPNEEQTESAEQIGSIDVIPSESIIVTSDDVPSATSHDERSPVPNTKIAEPETPVTQISAGDDAASLPQTEETWKSPISENSGLKSRMSMFEQNDAEAEEWKKQREAVLREKRDFDPIGSRKVSSTGDVIRETLSFEAGDSQALPEVAVPASLTRIPSADLPEEFGQGGDDQIPAPMDLISKFSGIPTDVVNELEEEAPGPGQVLADTGDVVSDTEDAPERTGRRIAA